ncbi:hypothetical protein Tco_0400082 [Tanacetum coccineum]
MELEDYVPVYIPEPEHPEDLVPAEDEAPIEPYITEPKISTPWPAPALEARIRVLETQAYRHEWQRQDADDRAIERIIRTHALEAGARVDTLEDTGSSA